MSATSVKRTLESDEPTLAPCPKCGGRRRAINLHPGTGFVTCETEGCKFRGPERIRWMGASDEELERAAVLAWNAQPAQTQA